MGDNEVIVGLTALVVLGVGAQWVGRRLGFPSLLLLLPAGLFAGQTDLVEPEALLGDTLFPLVTMLVALLLFQSGLNLRLEDLPRDAMGPVARLVTVGVLVTFLGAAWTLAAVTDVPSEVAWVLGAILTVSGPTVVGPLLSVVRPKGAIRAVLSWEGTVLDPVGATLGVVVLNLVLASTRESTIHPIWQMASRLGVGVAIGLAGAAVLVLVLSRFLVTDDMEAAVAVLVAVLCFGVAEVLLSEAGLFSTVVLGVVAANQRLVPTARIAGFGETLEVLIIGILFILLGALVELDALVDNLPAIVAVVAILVLVVRPLAVVLSQVGSSLPVRDLAFAMSLDPRGVVAAATAAQFTPVLDDAGIAADLMVPLVFGVILGTGLIYGLGAPVMGRVLGVTEPRPVGVVLVGTRVWLLELGRCLQSLGTPVLVLSGRAADDVPRDESLRIVSVAESESELREEMEHEPMRSAVVASDHGAVVMLVVAELVEQLGRSHVFVVPRHPKGALARLVYETWTPQPFAPDVTIAELDERIAAGSSVQLCEDVLPAGAIPLAVVREDGSVDLRPGLRRRPSGGRVVAMVGGDRGA